MFGISLTTRRNWKCTQGAVTAAPVNSRSTALPMLSYARYSSYTGRTQSSDFACICLCVPIAVQVVCHCSICRRCHSAPCAELAAYDNDRVRITKGAEELHMYNVFGESKEDRYFCTECGSKVLRCGATVVCAASSAAHGCILRLLHATVC